MGHLHALWHVALEQQEDGDLSSWSDELIAEASSFSGDAAQYVSLLQHHRWLDGKLLHDWLDYAGNYLARKYHNSNRAHLKRVWLKHGKHYGKSTSLRKRKGSPDPGNLLLSSSLKSSSSEGGVGETAGWPSPQKLIELYNEIACDDYPAVEKITEGRIKKARTYLRQFPEESFWREVFIEMNRSDFLRGNVKSNGHESFTANFDWLLTKGKDGTENAVKVFEGRYGAK